MKVVPAAGAMMAGHAPAVIGATARDDRIVAAGATSAMTAMAATHATASHRHRGRADHQCSAQRDCRKDYT
ncbi:hypothetical protein LB524_23140 [Mesorhizobium sp. ESP6-5]|uniref:hypothetical protein n=1 Tax=unclassified Mesorhizobium TaxID=325217 RepID=UPI001CCB876A|nr:MULTISPECIES: hypothetical protein [unclassified Mesorhizobium]MBZ9758185.1 hypothetical protein [Mesorhizobium sp. ESP6-5]